MLRLVNHDRNGPAEPNGLLTQLALNAPDRDRILRGNVARLFRL